MRFAQAKPPVNYIPPKEPAPIEPTGVMCSVRCRSHTRLGSHQMGAKRVAVVSDAVCSFLICTANASQVLGLIYDLQKSEFKLLHRLSWVRGHANRRVSLLPPRDVPGSQPRSINHMRRGTQPPAAGVLNVHRISSSSWHRAPLAAGRAPLI